MLDLDRELFDEFKRVDMICRDMFSTQQGVSEYIRQMEQTPASLRCQVPSWDRDYRTLKRLRWLRNQIAHETCATDCGIDDVENMKDFHNRLLTQQDPLAVLGKIRREAQGPISRRPSTRSPQSVPGQSYHQPPVPQRNIPAPPRKQAPYRSGCLLSILALLVVMVVLLFKL